MDMFALEDQITQWETALPTQTGSARLAVLLPLAWQLRQRDTERALQLVEEIEHMLRQSSLFEVEHQATLARLHLIRGEVRWLMADLEGAEQHANEAQQLFNAQQDALGSADAHWLHSVIVTDRGDMSACARHLDAMIALSHGHDQDRVHVAEAALARAAVYQDLREGEATWGQHFDVHTPGLHAGCAVWFNDFYGCLAYQSNDFGRAATFWIETFEQALATGQLRRAIVAATNIGGAFGSLADFETALAWMQRGLDLARPTRWPSSIGLCLVQTADAVRLLGRLDTAHDLLQEALLTLANLQRSRAYAMALTYLSDLMLAQKDYADALEKFSELDERGRDLKQLDFVIESARGRAHALSHLGRPEDARAAACEALELAGQQNSNYRKIAALEVLADIHTRHRLAPPAGMSAANPTLHFLQEAVALADSIDGYCVSADLLDAMATAYANAEDFAQAYRVSLQANTVRNRTKTQEATNRAIALQIKYKTERAQAEGEHHRQLAAEEAKRAEVLAQTSATLERLGRIGQEITQHLNASAVFETLDRHVHLMLDAPFFAVFLLNEGGSALEFAFGVEDGKILQTSDIELNDPSAHSARCVRELRELLIEMEPDEVDHRLIPGTVNTMTKLFVPLIVAGRVIGVMSIQSQQRQAYSDRERLIFRSLCAYGAIALDNAAAYRQLREIQAELVDKNAELEEAYKTLEEVSLTDPLTGLHNRRFLLQHVESDIALTLRRYEDTLAAGGTAEAAGADVVFFVIDFDQFKQVNDQYGHASGDMVLVQMAQRLRNLFRESDYLIRWGGEEFLVVARATNRSEAEAVAERIRAAVANEAFELADGTTLSKSCSIGFASYPFFPDQPRILSWSQVLELADQSLYMAKNGGRNQWIGLYGMACSQPDGVFQRLMRQTIKAVQAGEVRLVSSSR